MANPEAQRNAPSRAARATEPPGPRLDLSGFEPLLALPALSGAKAACDAGHFRRCAEQVHAYLETAETSAFDQPRWHLLLGGLYEKGESCERALESYETAAEVAWPLTDYALLGAARCLDALGRDEEAARRLANISPAVGTYADAQIHFAELTCGRGDAESCLRHLRTFLAEPHLPARWSQRGFRVAARLADLLSNRPRSAAAMGLQLRALGVLRELANLAPHSAARFGSAQLEQALLDALPEDERVKHRQLSASAQLERAKALSAAGRHDDAQSAAEALIDELGGGTPGPIACEALLLSGKSLARRRRRSAASKLFEEVVRHCEDDDARAWSLYLMGKYAYQGDRFTDTEHWMARLEKEAPQHRLADDGRLYRALAQRDMGVEARFSELLSRMPEDYPKGDMTLDGVFLLALNRMKKSDWGGALVALERAVALAGDADVERGTEWSGRERYFLARALVEVGDRERGLHELEALIRNYPLSYYMLHAYTRLTHLDPARGRRALAQALLEAQSTPLVVPTAPELEAPELLRVLEQFRQGNQPAARRELSISGVLRNAPPRPVLWALARLYARAGSARHSHTILRHRLRDWLTHWPQGPWAAAWQLAFPRPFLGAVTQQAEAQSVEPALLYAVMREESAFHEKAVSPANAYGLMQVIPETAKYFGKRAGIRYDKTALTTADISIALGSHVLARYSEHFPDDPLLAIPAYNAGPGRPKRWLANLPGPDFDLWVELIPYRETRRYTKRVLASRAAYAFLYYRSDGEDPFRLPVKLGARRPDR